MTGTGAPAQGIVLDIPPDFHEVPLDLAVEDRVAARIALLDRLGLTESARREGFALFLEAVSRAVGDGPVVATSFCAVQLGGRPSTATLTVATQTGVGTDPLVSVYGVAETLIRRGAYRSVRVDRAGPHPVVLATSQVRGGASAEAGSPDLHEVTVVVPVPGLALLTLLTITCTAADLATYTDVVRAVAASLRVASD
ncbi:MAG: hypothetical protein H0V13_07555 [Nocardioidaceae bacterium]|nr:hypothetical protein [Nocardioidaceae bacterium]